MEIVRDFICQMADLMIVIAIQIVVVVLNVVRISEQYRHGVYSFSGMAE